MVQISDLLWLLAWVGLSIEIHQLAIVLEHGVGLSSIHPINGPILANPRKPKPDPSGLWSIDHAKDAGIGPAAIPSLGRPSDRIFGRCGIPSLGQQRVRLAFLDLALINGHIREDINLSIVVRHYLVSFLV